MDTNWKILRLGLYDVQAQDFGKILVQTGNRYHGIKLHLQDIRGIPPK